MRLYIHWHGHNKFSNAPEGADFGEAEPQPSQALDLLRFVLRLIICAICFAGRHAHHAMDFWSRLVGGSGRQSKQPSPKKINPQQRLDRFKRVHNSVLQGCSKPQLLGQPGPRIERLIVDLRQLSAHLREELRSPAPYTCLSFSASSQIYGVIGRAASICKDESVISEAVTIFSIFVDSEVEGFLSSRSFARSLMRFSMRVLDSGCPYATEETESQLVEVLFAIAAKIRLEPDILEVWFAPSGRTNEDEEAFVREKKSFVGITQKDDFPLCYLFIDRVHHEGRVGDFARTGLLYIFESASRSTTLDAWIVASDLPTLMASALGALYSQLSRELSLLQDPNSLPMLLAMSDYHEYNQETGVETIASDTHKAHMATFLSDLTFWQDILDHCKSVDVKQTLLDHFQILFLQQLLYPSLLQSSDTDGGSSVAVMTYLNSILQTLTDESLSNMLLTYLLGTSTRSSPDRPPSPSVLRRRSSLMIMNSEPDEEERLEPSLFNLVDLIHNGLQSRNPQATFAALKLFTTILTLQPAHALGALVRLTTEQLTSQRTVAGVAAETTALMSVAASIGGIEGMDEAFSGASYDVRRDLEATAARRAQASHGFNSRNNSVIFTEMQRHISKSMLDTNETGLKAIISLIENFLCNGVDTNLALTEAVLALCMSVEIDLCELLAVRSDQYNVAQSANDRLPAKLLDPTWLDEDETSAITSVLTTSITPTLTTNNAPLILTTLRSLEGQVNALRSSLSRFDALLQKRKGILQTPQQTDNLFATPAKAVKSTPAVSLSRHVSPSPAPIPSRPSSRHAGTPQHLRHTPIASLSSSPTRATSIPRGRRPSTNLTVAGSSGGGGSPYLSPSRNLADVFRPPPPEVDGLAATASPPRMAPLYPGNLLPSQLTPGRTLSPRCEKSDDDGDGGGRFFTASPGPGGENDAETLALRVRFDARGRVVGIGTKGGARRDRSGGGGTSGLGSGVESRARSRSRSPAGLVARLRRGEQIPSSRASEAGTPPPPVVRSPSRDRSGRDEGHGRRDERARENDHEEDPDRGHAERDGKEEEEEEEVEEGEDDDDDGSHEVSLGHVLTNIVVLQNFILELVAVLQHRARVYEGEVRFDE